MERYDKFVNEFINLPTREKIDIHNMYCDDFCYDDKIYRMEEFDNVMEDYTPTDIVNKLCEGFSTSDNYFMFNRENNLVSFNDKRADEETKFYLHLIYDIPLIWSGHIELEEE